MLSSIVRRCGDEAGVAPPRGERAGPWNGANAGVVALLVADWSMMLVFVVVSPVVVLPF